MIFLEAHKKTILLLVLGVLCLLVAPIFLGKLKDALAQHNNFLNQQKIALERDLQRSKFSSELDTAGDVPPPPEEQESLLAPTNRGSLLKQLQKSALGYNITNLSVHLSAEQPAPDALGLPDLATSLVSFSGDAPHDASVQKYLQHVASVMTGRLQMKSLSLKRLSSNSVALTNLHFEATYNWTANKAAPAGDL